MLRALLVSALLALATPGALTTTTAAEEEEVDLSAVRVTAYDPARLQDYCKKPVSLALEPVFGPLHRNFVRFPPTPTGRLADPIADSVHNETVRAALASLAAADPVTADFLRHAESFTGTWCEGEFFTAETLQAALEEPRREVLSLLSETEAVVGRILGRTLYMAKQKRVEVKIRRTEKCYNAIAVTDDRGNHLFAAPFTRALSPNAAEVPCTLPPAFKIGGQWIEFGPEPKKIAPPRELDPMLPLDEQLKNLFPRRQEEREDAGPEVQQQPLFTTENNLERHSTFWKIVNVLAAIGQVASIYIVIRFLYRLVKDYVSKKTKSQKEKGGELAANKGYTDSRLSQRSMRQTKTTLTNLITLTETLLLIKFVWASERLYNNWIHSVNG
ncbi:Mitochondrial distribution and morphology protein 34 [Frankliniella fusca]|uniref:Mitochondrial distribution and morphology protein 34 n=1 Tax=Frankliniella fusca TaxID=407009 RepID=A0AAE1GST9_9NEOP|nr:Mitochondrial distribution and morphology protein 34 [Frankliniella fusca]